MKKVILSYLLFIYSLSVTSAVSVLSGVEPSFAGKHLILKSYLDQIASVERTLAVSDVDSSGAFSFSVDITEPMQVFIPTETYNGFIYLEPGKNYKVNIPVYQERTLPQKLDPYYKPSDFLLEVIDLKPEDFNAKLMQFEDAFDFYSMKHLVYGAKVDSILSSISQMKSIFPDLTSDPYLNQFMEYRYLLLLNMAPQIYQDSLITRLNALGVNENNPAFWDVFNNIFSDFIKQSAYDREQYLSFQQIIEEGNVKMYFTMIAKRYGITDPELKELAAIKWLADLLNHNDFDQMKVLDLLQKIGGGIKSKQNRELLEYILNNVPFNFIGLPAPDFEATFLDDKKCKISDFFGKYIYLNFGNSMIDQTQKDLNVLTRFQEEYKNDLQIINVCLYDSKEQVSKLSARFKDKMIFLLADNPDELKKKYNIKSVPSFILLDIDGNFLMTKGAEPNDELKMLFQRIMKIK